MDGRGSSMEPPSSAAFQRAHSQKLASGGTASLTPRHSDEGCVSHETPSSHSWTRALAFLQKVHAQYTWSLYFPFPHFLKWPCVYACSVPSTHPGTGNTETQSVLLKKQPIVPKPQLDPQGQGHKGSFTGWVLVAVGSWCLWVTLLWGAREQIQEIQPHKLGVSEKTCYREGLGEKPR